MSNQEKQLNPMTKKDEEFIKLKKYLRPYVWLPVVERATDNIYFVKLENITENHYFIVRADFKTIKKEQTTLLAIVTRFQFLFNVLNPKELIVASNEEIEKIKPLEAKFSRMEKLYKGHLNKEIDF